jgi:hypothetical protein
MDLEENLDLLEMAVLVDQLAMMDQLAVVEQDSLGHRSLSWSTGPQDSHYHRTSAQSQTYGQS